MLGRSLISNALKPGSLMRFSAIRANARSFYSGAYREKNACRLSTTTTKAPCLRFTSNKHLDISSRPFHTSANVLTTYYTEEHEWLKLDGGVATIGITEYAKEQLGEIVFCECPEVDTEFEQGDQMVVLESVKAVSYLYAPASGTVIEVNQTASDKPEIIYESPTERGWLVKMKLSNEKQLEELMDEKGYMDFIKE